MTPLRVLITNITLATRTGTETYVRDLARGLVRRGHQPIVYSPELGDIAREIEAATVPVVSDLRQVGKPPDVIHGHHYAETLTALLYFPGVPAVGFCHDWGSFWDTPVRMPRVRRHVAVDDTCRDRLIARHGIPEQQVRVVLNAVDVEQFPPRGPLPATPRRALVFSNSTSEDNNLSAVRAACETAGITLDVVGQSVGASCARPGELLGNYDLVFAKARCALEAMAVGTAVIVCDIGGVGGMVTTENFDQFRRWNFGRRALREPVRPQVLVRELACYDAADAGAVSRRVRQHACLETVIEELLALYREVIAEQQQAGPADSEVEGRVAGESLRWLTPYIREIHTQRGRLVAAVRERDELQTLYAKALRQCSGMPAIQIEQAADVVRLQQENAMLRADCERLQGQLADVHRSTMVRLARRLRSLPLVPGMLRLAQRRLAGS